MRTNLADARDRMLEFGEPAKAYGFDICFARVTKKADISLTARPVYRRTWVATVVCGAGE